MRVTLFAVVLCLLLISGAVYAQMDQDQNQAQTNAATSFNATVQQGPVLMRGQPASADVFVNGRLAMRIGASAAGMTPMQRAQVIADRLNQQFAAGVNWNDMRVAQINHEWAVTLGNNLVATATTGDARSMGTSTGSLASRWANQTVVALGGQPSMIAAQLRPSLVAGAQQQTGMPGTVGAGPGGAWSVTPWKQVPMINGSTGAQIGMATVGGPQIDLNRVKAVAVYQSTSGSNTVWSFVPISSTSVTGTVRRVNQVGLVRLPEGMLPLATASTMSSTDVTNMVTQNSAQWNSMINSNLSNNNLGLTASTSVVPLYDLENKRVVGAAQVVGTAAGIGQAQAVAAWVSDGEMRFNATQSTPDQIMGMPPTLNDVVVSAIILPGTAGVPGATGGTNAPGMTNPNMPSEQSGEQGMTPQTGEEPEENAPETEAPEQPSQGNEVNPPEPGNQTPPQAPPESGTTTP